jgi:uncharacterized protein YjbI with pentapeptide repeats
VKRIEIKHRWTGTVLYATDVADDDPYPIRTAVANANLNGAYLTGADLANANLTGADLANANLNGAYLANADLNGAYLTGADLTNANLNGADLANADLANANLNGAYLTGADLTNANLNGADLANADLRSADLSGADLDPIRDDLRLVLDSAPVEVAGLLAALRAGTINGSTYSGSCACLVGTIANIRGCEYDRLEGLRPDSGRPAEKWFLALRAGHTPDNSQVAAITEGWLLEWQAARGEGELLIGGES